MMVYIDLDCLGIKTDIIAYMDWLVVRTWLATVDWLALAALLSAAGTLIVAVITFVNVKMLRRQINLIENQTKLIERQTIIQRSSIYPLLEWDRVGIKENTVRISLTNKGKGPAIRIGLRTLFHHCQYPNGQISDPNFLYETGTNRKVYPSGMVTIMRGPGGKSRLHPQDTAKFSGEIMFQYTPFESPAEYPWRDLIHGKVVYVHKDYTFDELSALIMANKLQFIAVFVDIVYMDISEQILEVESLYRIIVDLNKHRNMEEAVKDGMAPRFIQKSLEDIPGLSWEDYQRAKSWRAFLDDFRGFDQ